MLLQLRRLVADLLSQTTECRCQCRRISSQLFQTGAFSARVGAGAQGWTPVARWHDKGCGLSFQSLNFKPQCNRFSQPARSAKNRGTTPGAEARSTLHRSNTGADLARNFSSNLAGRAWMSTDRALSSSQEAAALFRWCVRAGEDMSRPCRSRLHALASQLAPKEGHSPSLRDPFSISARAVSRKCGARPQR